MITFSAMFQVAGTEAPEDKKFIELKHATQPGFLLRIMRANAAGIVKRFYVARYQELQPDGSLKDTKKTLGLAIDVGTGEPVLSFRDAQEAAYKLLTQAKASASGARTRMSLGDAGGIMLKQLDSIAATESETYKLKLRTNYSNYLEQFADKPLDGLKEPFWRAFREDLLAGDITKKKKPLAVATIEGIFSCASRLYSIAHDNRGILDEPADWNPTVGVMKATEPANKKESYIPLDKLGEVWLASDALVCPGWRDMFRIYLLTGLRDSLVKNLRWENVDFERGSFMFDPLARGAKNRKSALSANDRKKKEEMPVSSLVLDILRRRKMFAPAGNPWVFYAQAGGKTRMSSDRLVDPRSAWAPLESQVGMHIAKHDLRRTFASLACTVAPESIMHISLLLMHSNKSIASFVGVPQITFDYIQGQIDSMREVSNRISDAILELASERPKSALTARITSYALVDSVRRELDREEGKGLGITQHISHDVFDVTAK